MTAPKPPVKFQIGKAGITEGTIQTLKSAFLNHKQARISVLKSSGRDRNTIHEMAKELCNKLGFPEVYRVIGFTIIIIKP